MTSEGSGSSDSYRAECGSIPGMPGQSAFRLVCSQPSAIPVVIAVPHAGRAYPAALLERMRSPAHTTLRLEDRHADRLASAVARETGAALLVAHAPRAMIDLNRAVDEMDWEMLAEGVPAGAGPPNGGRRALSGLGLVPRRLPGLGEIWNRRLEESELRARIDCIHRPYHAALDRTMRDLRDRWGAALLIDLHSMPPLGSGIAGDGVPQFVIGDRFGATCDGALCAAAFDELSRLRRRAAHNRPYAGGYVLERHSAPAKGLHAMQLEICRAAYLDAHLAEPGPGFDAVTQAVACLVRRLSGEVAALGRGGEIPQAAE